MLSSHLFDDVSRATDEVVILRAGQLGLQAPLPALQRLALYRLPDTRGFFPATCPTHG